jgi:uncharacterized membrane protein
MIVLGLAIASLVCAIVGLATGRSAFYGVAVICLAAIPLLGYLT